MPTFQQTLFETNDKLDVLRAKLVLDVVEEAVSEMADVFEAEGYEFPEDTTVEQFVAVAEQFIASEEFDELDEAAKKGFKMVFGKMAKLGKAALRSVKKTVKKVKQGYHGNRARAAVKRADAPGTKMKEFGAHLKTASKHARKSGDKHLQKTVKWARKSLKSA